MSRKKAAKQPPPPAERSRAGRFVTFLICFVLSLAVSKVFEFVTSKETYDAAAAVQATWKRSLEGYAPLSLATGYWQDVKTVFTLRDKAFSTPETPKDPVPGLPAGPKVVPSNECRSLHLGMTLECRSTTLGDKWRSKCRENRANAEKKFNAIPLCRAWNEQMLAERRFNDWVTRQSFARPKSSQPDDGKKGLMYLIGSPILGLLKTYLRLTQDGGWSYLWGALQLAMGVPAFMLVHSALASTPYQERYFPEHPIAWIIIVPPGVVVASSLLAFPLKYLMLGGLAALGWFTGLAGACCTATGVAGFCWWCSHKFAEYSVSEAIEKKIG